MELNSLVFTFYTSRLYYHECQRVFHDRLTDDLDRNIFCNSLAELCSNILKEPTSAQEMKGIIYGDFMKMGVDRENRVYDEIINKDKMKRTLTVRICRIDWLESILQ